MSELVSSTRDGDVAVITINNPPVNAMSPGVPEGIAAGIEQLEKDPTLKAAVLIGGGRTFIAGADITKFAQLREKGEGVQLNVYLNKVEGASKPVVCAIHGTAFGGGLETAMSCHYRVALASAQVGQPEVKL
jgi:3-hydroxyacyl-CoA dehydrogenase